MKYYEVKDKQIQKQIKRTEYILDREMTYFEKQLFEWAYTQGKEDFKEGKVK